MLTTKIDGKIVDWEIIKESEKTTESGKESEKTKSKEDVLTNKIVLLKRPEELEGATYKIKSHSSDNAFYVTINDIVVNGVRKPFEIFINSKEMDNFAWVVALTRVISAIFRHGGDPSFLIEELGSVFDPKGGYYKKGGRYMPSLVADIGDCLKKHLDKIGQGGVKSDPINTKENVDTKLKETRVGIVGKSCPKCHQMSFVKSEGCERCFNCDYSKCG